jgi:KDO2-lipid IV(A) lauroyltransferase
MRWMKKDMGGAANALGLATMVMALKLPVNLQLLIPAVENAVSGNAFRPGDVIKTRKGLHIEIGNTDAEGRVILCDALAYAAVRAAICVIQALPRPTCERFARRWADFLANRVKIRRRVVRENLQIAFPEWSAAECREVARGMWEHLLLMVIEIAHAPRVIRKTTWRKHLRIHGMEEMVRTLWLDRPKVILSGHFGNFELAAYLFGVFGLQIFSVARELDNPLLDDFVTAFRESRGQRILPKKGSAPDVALVFKENGAIGLLGDQAAGPKGCWVEFFGQPASVHKAIGVFARARGTNRLISQLGSVPAARRISV